jgi:tetratricopeptide (TPR) repeat protein
VAKPYLAPNPVATTAALDPRALAFVIEGERALSDGNLEACQGAFDRASAFAERDPRVLIDEARVAAAKADIPWLKVRLLGADARDEMRVARADLSDQVARVRKAADAAIAVAPDDPGALRVHIDSLRLAGDPDAARREAPRIMSLASQPDTAYVLAALDLSANEPLWTTVLDRLRIAVAGEGNAGRARAALVYALTQAGEVVNARTELAKLDGMTRPHPLLASLHAFVDHAASRASTDGGVAATIPHFDVSSLPQSAAPPAGVAPGGNGDEPSIPGETSSAMKAAQGAIRKGDWNRARAIYDALVSRNPNDSEALAGLGDVARAQGDSGGALSAYKRALSVNPSYLPALLGVADTQWANGDRSGAIRAYKDIVDRFPEGTYPPYIKSRTEAPPPVASAAAAPSDMSQSPAASVKPAPSSSGSP